MARPLTVAIVGAGMGGLATAAALRRVGIDVTVYEQAVQFARLGAGIQIGCNAMKVLRGLGLESRLRGQSFYPRSWNNRDWQTGEVKFDMIFGETAEQKFGAPYLLAHRGDLHAALASAVPNESIKLGHKTGWAGRDWLWRPIEFRQWCRRGCRRGRWSGRCPFPRERSVVWRLAG